MSYTNGLDKPSDYFNTKLYTGNGSTNAITGVGFQPDWVWLKDRDNANSHKLYDGVRGATEYLISDTTSAEATQANGLTSFDSDGFTLGSYGGTNGSGNNMVSWNWLASNTTASNTDGSITSTVSANTTSGFSIVSWTGTGSATTLGHGLGAKPRLIIQKNRDSGSTQWRVQHGSLGATKHMALDATQAVGTSTSIWNDTEPTTSVFTVGNDFAVNNSGDNCIAYVFAEKKGFSKFGSYTGSSGLPFVYTGFKPAFVMIKCATNVNTSYSSWTMIDNKRNPHNEAVGNCLYANKSSAEGLRGNGSDSGATEPAIDFLSNGFKIRSDGVAEINQIGSTHVYMAFAESPFTTSTGIPTTAR